jgi:GGDEF domain-containing protein
MRNARLSRAGFARGEFTMDVALQLRRSTESRSRSHELAAQLRSAALEGDEPRIARLLGDLLRLKWLTKGQRVALQLQALQNLVTALRSAATADEATGLCNRRGFMQGAARALDLAVRDQRPHSLLYFHLGHLQVVADTVAPATRLVLVRQLGNFLRDLYPRHGLYEVVGRLSASEFVALTPEPQHASREAVLLRLRKPAENGGELPLVRLDIGVAHFDPERPVAIDELLDTARRAMHLPTRGSRVASSAFPPQTGMTRC